MTCAPTAIGCGERSSGSMVEEPTVYPLSGTKGRGCRVTSIVMAHKHKMDELRVSVLHTVFYIRFTLNVEMYPNYVWSPEYHYGRSIPTICGLTLLCPLPVTTGGLPYTLGCNNGGTCPKATFCCSDGTCTTQLNSCGEKNLVSALLVVGVVILLLEYPHAAATFKHQVQVLHVEPMYIQGADTQSLLG